MNPARILVADDDLTTALLMQAALVQSGFTVVLAADGEAALQASTRKHLDMVLLDVDMPRLDGYAVCRELRRRCGDELPILMVNVSVSPHEHLTRQDHVLFPSSATQSPNGLSPSANVSHRSRSCGGTKSEFDPFIHFCGVTYNYSGLGSDNNSGIPLPSPFSWIIPAFSHRVEKIIVGIAFRQ